MAPPISNPAELPEAFEQRSALAAMMSGAATTGAAGVLISAVQNSLQTHRAGALGVVTRTGGTIAFFTALGGAFSFAESMSANVRQRNDAWNTAIGGAAAGLVVGARARSIPTLFGASAGLALLLGVFDEAGASLTGSNKRPSLLDAVGRSGDADSDHVPVGSRGWREERDERRRRFFKQPKEDVQTSE
ncbi:hypothetical protein FA09DRAFT_330186 [Tilletiopsis washingtonensis]|uniref:Uncharacterized protein n=1 Tax=Tilletiopsis washingtonensis TaxID=58919 RepID=A0A316Z9Q8_9BASI|nr:hypothetical protein FA09DRAFT_330186 [Tilletiopsis washingtonensis]PWN98026.1 hypothetical protein FA09DRAFT_330186 [Tilletiopsis washingtonensis]